MPVTEPLLRRGATPVVIAHRGASAAAPENTMAAFHAAWRAGACCVETDVQPAADDTLVLMHDDEVDRTTDGTGPVARYSGAELAALDAGSWFDPAFAGARVPTLAQLLAEVTGGRRLMLEVKGEYRAPQVRSVVEHLRAADAGDRVFLQSFQVPVLRELRAILPDEPLGLLVEVIGDDPIGDCRTLGAVTYNPSVEGLLERPDLVAELHAAGIATIPWFSNDADEWAALTDLGVDGIFTDRPAALLAWQAQRAD